MKKTISCLLIATMTHADEYSVQKCLGLDHDMFIASKNAEKAYTVFNDIKQAMIANNIMIKIGKDIYANCHDAYWEIWGNKLGISAAKEKQDFINQIENVESKMNMVREI